MSFVYYLTSLDYGHELQYLIYLPVVGEPYYSPGVIPFIFWSSLSQWLAVAVHLPFYHYYIYNSSVVAVLSMVCCFRLAIFLPLPSLLLVCSLPWWLAVAVISIFFYHCYLQFFTTFGKIVQLFTRVLVMISYYSIHSSYPPFLHPFVIPVGTLNQRQRSQVNALNLSFPPAHSLNSWTDIAMWLVLSGKQ